MISIRFAKEQWNRTDHHLQGLSSFANLSEELTTRPKICLALDLQEFRFPLNSSITA